MWLIFLVTRMVPTSFVDCRPLEVPFLVLPNLPNLGAFGNMGGTFGIFRCPKMGLRAPKSKNGDHFFTRTPPQNGGLGICFMCSPRKVIFGHFIDFEYFGSDFSCYYIVKEIKTSNGRTKIVYGSIMLKFLCVLQSPNRTIYPEGRT